MPLPTDLTTTWPVGGDLRTWLQANTSISPSVDEDLIDDVVADSVADVFERLDPDKLPDDESCPRPVHRQIVLEAARLLFQRQAVHGVVTVGANDPVAIRLRDLDNRRLRPWMISAEP